MKALALAEAARDSLVVNRGRTMLSYFTQVQDRFDEAEAIARAGLQSCRETGDLVSLIRMLFQLGHCLAEQLRFDESAPCFEEAVATARDLNDPFGEMSALGAWAEVCRFTGDLPRALLLIEQTVAFGKAHVHPLDPVSALDLAGEGIQRRRRA